MVSVSKRSQSKVTSLVIPKKGGKGEQVFKHDFWEEMGSPGITNSFCLPFERGDVIPMTARRNPSGIKNLRKSLK